MRDYGTATWEGGSPECNHEIPDNERDPKNPQAGSHIARFNRESCYKCGAKRIDKQLGLERTFKEYINKLCDIFDEVKRVLRKDGTCWVNLGDTYASTPSGLSNEKAEEWNKKGDGLFNRLHKRNTNNMSTETTWKPTKYEGVIEKSLCMIPFRFAIEMQNRGWILRNVIIWHKPNCMPSSIKDRFTVDFEYLFFFVKSKKYWFETQYEPIKTETLERNKYGEDGNGKGVYACGRLREPGSFCSKMLPIGGNKKNGDRTYSGNTPEWNELGRNKRTVWSIPTHSFSEAHFATYPEEFIETPIKAGCPKDGIVLDPFFGAGTTGVVAWKQCKKFIGIELNPEYIEIANKRLKPFLEQKKLLDFEPQKGLNN